jgi:hypothetical protein
VPSLPRMLVVKREAVVGCGASNQNRQRPSRLYFRKEGRKEGTLPGRVTACLIYSYPCWEYTNRDENSHVEKDQQGFAVGRTVN